MEWIRITKENKPVRYAKIAFIKYCEFSQKDYYFGIRVNNGNYFSKGLEFKENEVTHFFYVNEPSDLHKPKTEPYLKINSSDIATIEALHDKLLDEGILGLNAKIMNRSRELTKRMSDLLKPF